MMIDNRAEKQKMVDNLTTLLNEAMVLTPGIGLGQLLIDVSGQQDISCIEDSQFIELLQEVIDRLKSNPIYWQSYTHVNNFSGDITIQDALQD